MNEMEELMSMCDAVPLPDPDRLARTRAKVADAITKSPSAGRRARGPGISKLGHLSGSVTPINTVTNTALKPVTVGADPFGIGITPDGRTVYVLNNNTDTVTPIRTATNTALKPITVGRYPEGIAITRIP
jgi:YVTN family beta-propeller protein